MKLICEFIQFMFSSRLQPFTVDLFRSLSCLLHCDHWLCTQFHFFWCSKIFWVMDLSNTTNFAFSTCISKFFLFKVLTPGTTVVNQIIVRYVSSPIPPDYIVVNCSSSLSTPVRLFINQYFVCNYLRLAWAVDLSILFLR